MMKHSLEEYRLFFSSLSNPNRLQIITLLRRGKKNVTEISNALGFEQTMVSHNLKRLERCGMVFKEKKGRHRYYMLNRKTITPLMDLIDAHIHHYCVKVLRGER
jgi:DNA-binding transcriptional ArsR family regulator